MIKHIHFWCFLFCTFLSTSLFAGKLELTLKPVNSTGEIETLAWAALTEGGNPVDMISAEKGKGMLFELEFSKLYTIKVSSKNHEEVTIIVNTDLPVSEQKYVYSSTSTFELVEKKNGFDTKFSSPPSFTISYNKSKDAFSVSKAYEPSYTYAPAKPKEEKPKEVVKEEQPKEEPELEKAEPIVEEEPVEEEPIKEESPIEEPAVVEEEPEPVIEKPIIDNLTPAIERGKIAKQKLNEIEEIKSDFEDENTLNLIERAKIRRSFYEEYSDSQTELKKDARNYNPQQ